MPPHIVPSSDEEVRMAMEALRHADLSTISVDEVKQHLQIILRGHILSVPVFEPGVTLYRARKVSALPALLSEIGAPPPLKIVRDQRCNRAGESLFYCSSARNAPFFEIHSQVGDRIVLSEWRTTAPLAVNHVGYTQSNFERLQSSRSAPCWGPSTPPAQVSPRTRMIDEFFSSFFSVDVGEGQEHLYKATIAMTEAFIPEPDPDAIRFDGLMYPTIPMKGNCENFAIKLQFVKRSVTFVKAEYLMVRQIEGMKMQFDILDFAPTVQADGTLDWKGRPGNWVLKNQGDQLRFSVEQGEWVARDSNGNVVPME